MAKLSGFGAEVVDGKLMLVASDHTRTGLKPATIFKVSVLVGVDGIGHRIEAKMTDYKGEVEFDRKAVECDTMEQMEHEAMRLRHWGMYWTNKKMQKAFFDMVRALPDPLKA